MPLSVSIIVCTRNRAASLRATLASIGRTFVPPGASVELIVVDNGSTDATPEVVRAFSPPSMRVRLLMEPRPGKSYALNRALRAATGTCLLFTDDDVRVPGNWIAGMTKPLVDGTADAVAGGVTLPAHLQRPWMNERTTALLALTDGLDPQRPPRLIGANMAIHRRVFDVIPQFDVELGPGQLGLEEETLLSLQIRAAGLDLLAAFDVAVEHHLGTDRLQREAFVAAAERLGRSDAYVSYHWRHDGGNILRSLAGMAKVVTRLAMGRLHTTAPAEGLPVWELRVRRHLYYHRQMLVEVRRPRNYERHGLRKMQGVLGEAEHSDAPAALNDVPTVAR